MGWQELLGVPQWVNLLWMWWRWLALELVWLLWNVDSWLPVCVQLYAGLWCEGVSKAPPVDRWVAVLAKAVAERGVPTRLVW